MIGTFVNDLSLPDLYRRLAATGHVRRLVELARDEDLADIGDLTSILTRELRADSGGAITAVVRARRSGVVAGLACLPDLVEAFEFSGSVTPLMVDGETCSEGADLVRITGDRCAITTIERTLLNLLGRACGVATVAREFVDQARRGGDARICDTRKTTPGLRAVEKYAVRCGGGWLHRVGLHDAVLLKDNHLDGLDDAAFADLAIRVAAKAQERIEPDGFVEVEVDNLGQFQQLARAKFVNIDAVLLDNMTLEELREAVAIVTTIGGGGVELEASGGVSLDTIADIAATGVDRISVGAMTHSAVSLDLGLDS